MSLLGLTELLFKRACDLSTKNLDATDMENMQIDELRKELSQTRLVLYDIMKWIDHDPSSAEVQKARSAIKLFGDGNSTTTDSVKIQIDSSTAPRTPKSPRKGGWGTAASSLFASAKWKRKLSKHKSRPSVVQGQTAIEMSNLETKSSTKSEDGHDDHKLPEQLLNFQSLVEYPEIREACTKLQKAQREYAGDYVGGREKNLKNSEDNLRKNVKLVWDAMLKGVQGMIYKEKINDKLTDVANAGNQHFLNVYKAVFYTIQNTESTALLDYKKAVKSARAVIDKDSGPPKQITGDPVTLLTHALEIKERYETVMTNLINKIIATNETISKGDIRFTAAPVKKLQRVVEKSMLKPTIPGDASRTFDIVRGMVICKNVNIIEKLVNALTGLHKQAGGWRDYMDNIIICGDKNMHICELQIVHDTMIVARKGLPGHVVYGKQRNANEISSLYQGGSSNDTFHEIFWGSKQHAALAMLFIKCGGRFWHSNQKKGWCTERDLSKWSGIKLNQKGRVISLDISKRKLDEGLSESMLKPLTDIQTLNLKETSQHLISGGVSDDYESLGDSDISIVAKSCPALRVACFDFCAKITDIGLREVAKNCKNIEVLELQECDLITDKGISDLVANCPNLIHLNIKECDKISDNGLAMIGNLKHLRHLNLQDCDLITNTGIAHLKSLTTLNLNYCSEITDAGLVTVAKNNPDLESISLTELKISDSGVKSVCEKCQKLKAVSVYQCRRVGDSSLISMADNCKNIEVLDVAYCSKLTDKAMESIAKECKNLREIKIRNCQRITDAGLLALANTCEKLTRMDCFGCNLITDTAIRKVGSIRPSLVFDR